MSQLNTLKLKRAFYIMFGTIFDSTLLFLCGYLAYILPSGSKMSIGANCLVVFLLFFTFCIYISLNYGHYRKNSRRKKNLIYYGTI
jgi:hypothetical protein